MKSFIKDFKTGITYQYKLNNTSETDHYHSVRHSHPQIEIYLLLKGAVSYTINGIKTNIKEGELMVLNAYEYHVVDADPNIPYERSVLQIPPDIIPALNEVDPIKDFFTPSNYLFIIRKDDVSKTKIKEIMQNIYDLCLEDNRYRDHLILSKIIELVIEISNIKNSISNEKKDEFSEYAHPQIYKCIQYINNNLDKKISIDDITNNLTISKSRIQHLFKDVMGYSISDYIIKQKMMAAQKFLLWDKTPFEVAHMLGYDYYSTFFTAFKKFFGYTPMDVKKYINKKSPLD